MAPEKIGSLADDVKPLVLAPAAAEQRAHCARQRAARAEQGAAGPHRRTRGQARQAAEDAGQLSLPPRNPLILLRPRGRWRENVVPRFGWIMLDFFGRIATPCAHQHLEAP